MPYLSKIIKKLHLSVVYSTHNQLRFIAADIRKSSCLIWTGLRLVRREQHYVYLINLEKYEKLSLMRDRTTKFLPTTQCHAVMFRFKMCLDVLSVSFSMIWYPLLYLFLSQPHSSFHRTAAIGGFDLRQNQNIMNQYQADFYVEISGGVICVGCNIEGNGTEHLNPAPPLLSGLRATFQIQTSKLTFRSALVASPSPSAMLVALRAAPKNCGVS